MNVMNMHSAPRLTPAETALVEGFAARAGSLPGNEAVNAQRERAIAQIKAGLPTRRVEAWHYTDLRRLLVALPGIDRVKETSSLDPLLADACVLRLVDGRAETPPELPVGVSLSRVADKLADGSIAPALAVRSADDAVAAVNGAFVTDGWFLDIAEGAEIGGPLELQNLHGGGEAHVRFAMRVGDRARLSVVERQTGDGPALVSSVSNLTVGEGADVTWIIVQEQPGDATFLGQFNAWVGADAKLTVFVMNAGGKLVRQEVIVQQRGEGSEFRLRGINLLDGDTHCDVTMVLDHLAPDTTSTETIRNVATGRARGVFQGQIRVDREAQKTDAKMACNTLLLSDDAEFSAKPELEIFADDVACGHGATVTEIDRDHLFYLMARGIAEKTARGLLVKAFLAEVIEELDDEALVEALEAKLDRWFAAHG